MQVDRIIIVSGQQMFLKEKKNMQKMIWPSPFVVFFHFFSAWQRGPSPACRLTGGRIPDESELMRRGRLIIWLAASRA